MRRATMSDLADVNRWGGADFTEFLSNKVNVFLIKGDGGALFAWRGPGVFEVHLALEQRGRAALDTVHAMLAEMRGKYGADMFWSAIPIESRHVIMFARLMDWKSCGVAEMPHGFCEIFEKGRVCRQS